MEIDRLEGNKNKTKNMDSASSSFSENEATRLFELIFGVGVKGDVLKRWANQGIKLSSNPETSVVLVQDEGGPCGVLASIQAFFLKHLLFANDLQDLGRNCMSLGDFAILTEGDKTSASRVWILECNGGVIMADILFLCGRKQKAVIAEALEGLPLESASDFQSHLRFNTYTELESAIPALGKVLPLFRSSKGTLLFLISALLSRGLDSIQADRDDSERHLPLVVGEFGYTSQEIVNLLISGQAVSNVCDEQIIDGTLVLKAIKTPVSVGFLSVMEALSVEKVGQYLKHPIQPIWVIGGQNHYTLLFSFDNRLGHLKAEEINGNFEMYHINGMKIKLGDYKKSFDSKDPAKSGLLRLDQMGAFMEETNLKFTSKQMEEIQTLEHIDWETVKEYLEVLDKNLLYKHQVSRIIITPSKVDQERSDEKPRKEKIRLLSDIYNQISPPAKAKRTKRTRKTSNKEKRMRKTRKTTNEPLTSPADHYVSPVSPGYWEEFNNSLPPISNWVVGNPFVGTNVGDLMQLNPSNEDNADNVVELVPADMNHESRSVSLMECILTRWPNTTCAWTGIPPSID